MNRYPLILLLLVLSTSACGSNAGRDAVAADSTATDSIPPDQLPRFTETGELVRPEGWEGWVLAGTSIGLGYTEPTTLPEPGAAPGIFLNVYLQPWAYERFLATGEFPQGTMFILAGSDAVDRVDPARRGFTMGEIGLMEVHLKQEGLHETGWGFYGFGGDAASSPMISGEANCYSCHRDEAAHDHAFVQFYPKLRERLGIVTAADSAAGDP